MIYKDIIEKLEYHKERIRKDFIKSGYFPNNYEINEVLNTIDLRVSIFRKQKIAQGTLLNVTMLNKMIEDIYLDITILYKIINSIQKEKLNSMMLNLETHLLSLENIALLYKKRADEEINSTALGKTLLFKIDGWEVETNDDNTIISLGELELVQGSKISCFANIHNTEKNNIYFMFEADKKENSFTALPYNYNNDTYIIPGELKKIETDININDNFNINSEIKIPYNTNLNNIYKILGGKGKMAVTDKVNNNTVIMDIPGNDKPFVAKRSCFISFYIDGEENIEYNFNKKPLHSNFAISNGIINIKSNLQRIFLEVDEGFICYFNLNNNTGYAINTDALAYNDYLIYTGLFIVKDFKIIEYVRDKSIKYNVKVKITEHDNDEIIDSIYIKEIE